LEIVLMIVLFLAGAYAGNRIARWRGLSVSGMTAASAVLGLPALIFGLLAPSAMAKEQPSGSFADAMRALALWAIVAAVLIYFLNT